MAFGKNPEDLERVGTFRQQAQLQNKTEHRAYDGKGRTPYFINQFKPSLTGTSDVRIIPGDYSVFLPELDDRQNVLLDKDGKALSKEHKHMTYFPAVEHYNSSIKKGFICSGGPFHSYRKYAEPCRGCEVFYQQTSGKQKSFVSKRNLYVLTVLVFGEFAAVPAKNRQTGEPMVNEKTQKPYFNWEPVTRQNRGLYADYERRDWIKQPWAMSWQHWNTLLGFSSQVGRSCSNCTGRNTIQTEAYNCSECGDVVIDMSSTTLNDSEIEKIYSGLVVCPSCKHKGYLSELISCNSCASGQKAEIFDVNLTIGAQEDNSNPQIKKTTLIITYDKPSVLDSRFTLLNPEFHDTAIASPLPLHKQYAPYSIESQMEFVPTIPGNNKAVEQSRAYTKR